MQLAKNGMIILNLDDVVETNHILCQTNELSITWLASLEPIVLHEHGLPNLVTQEVFFLISIFDILAVNMTSCSKVGEEADMEDSRQENSPEEMDKTLASKEAMPVRLN